MLRRDESGICNAVSISEQDRSLGAFGLTEEPARISEWNHRRLVLDKTSAGIVDPELGERRMAYSAVKEPYDGKETTCTYVSVKGRQKRATLGAVFGVPSTTPNPCAWPL